MTSKLKPMALSIDRELFDKMQRQRRPYLAVLDCIRSDIAAGRLRSGDRLPTQRQLARQLGLAVGTVTKAYSEAARQRLVSTEVGRGTYVLDAPDDDAGALPYDLTFNQLAYEDSHPSELGSSLNKIFRRINRPGTFDYNPSANDTAYRTQAAQWLAGLGHDAGAEQILICNGVQHGLSLVLQSLAPPGALVLTEQLGFPGIGLLESVLGFRLKGVEMDRDGLRADSFRQLCVETRARILVCAPTLHNPTNSILPLDRRQEIVDIAREHDLTIVEYDVNGIPVEDPLPPLAVLAPERTIFITCTWKATGMGAALGYIVCPPQHMEHLAAVVQATTWTPSPLLREIVTAWIADGTSARIIAWHRQEIAARLKLATAALSGLDAQGHPASYNLWLALPEPWRREIFCEALANGGVTVSPADVFIVGRSIAPHAVRLNLGGLVQRQAVAKALAITAEIVKRGPQPRIVTG